MSEEFYDTEIAPILRELGKKCEIEGMPFFAAAEYEPGKLGRTIFVPPRSCLQMAMLDLCGKTGTNVDLYLMALKRHCKEKGIDFSGSIFLDRAIIPNLTGAQ